MMNSEPIDLNSDLGVVNAARVSMDKHHAEFTASDEGLLVYLANEGHWTPFAHQYCSFRITAPLFVARQLGRHQVGLVWSEVSRRYVSTPQTYWFPTSWRQAVPNLKQGSGSDLPAWRQWLSFIVYRVALWATDRAYKTLLNLGVCPEQARAVSPQATMTTWCWTGSLAAWNRVATLRLDPHAQVECQTIVTQIANECSKRYPHSWVALQNSKRE